MNPTGNIFFKQFHWKRQGIKKTKWCFATDICWCCNSVTAVCLVDVR
jgi:hypothetical protein